jgi:hypothetical protein
MAWSLEIIQNMFRDTLKYHDKDIGVKKDEYRWSPGPETPISPVDSAQCRNGRSHRVFNHFVRPGTSSMPLPGEAYQVSSPSPRYC